MTPNPYLTKYPNSEVDTLIRSGALPLRFDYGYNLLLDQSGISMYSSSFTLPLVRTSFNPIKVQTKFSTNFTELT